MTKPFETLSPGEATLGYVQAENEEKQTAVYFYEDRIDGESASSSTIEVRTGMTTVNGVVLIPIMISFPLLQSDYLYECWLDPMLHTQHLRDLVSQRVIPVRCYDKYRRSIPYTVKNTLLSIATFKAKEYVSIHGNWNESDFNNARNIVYDKYPTPQDLFKHLYNIAHSERWSF
jgi:hypothetical protein